MKHAAAVLTTFSLRLDPGGSLTAGLDVDAANGYADHDGLAMDVTDLFVAVGSAAETTGGYPYFLQELGYAVRRVADGPVVTPDDVRMAVPGCRAKLDESFFRVRLDRSSELQTAYLRAMAELGPEPQKAADVAGAMGRTSQNLAPTRAELINMGLLYTPEHGYAAFTVPQFDAYMRRAVRGVAPGLLAPGVGRLAPDRAPRAPREAPVCSRGAAVSRACASNPTGIAPLPRLETALTARIGNIDSRLTSHPSHRVPR